MISTQRQMRRAPGSRVGVVTFMVAVPFVLLLSLASAQEPGAVPIADPQVTCTLNGKSVTSPRIWGTADDDVIVCAHGVPKGTRVEGYAGNDTITVTGRDGDVGGEGNSGEILGEHGDDTIIVTGGNGVQDAGLALAPQGGAGNTGLIDGGVGHDTISVTGGNGGTIDVLLNHARGAAGGHAVRGPGRISGGEGNDSITAIGGVGGNHPERDGGAGGSGAAERARITGDAGNDEIVVRGGRGGDASPKFTAIGGPGGNGNYGHIPVDDGSPDENDDDSAPRPVPDAENSGVVSGGAGNDTISVVGGKGGSDSSGDLGPGGAGNTEQGQVAGDDGDDQLLVSGGGEGSLGAGNQKWRCRRR